MCSSLLNLQYTTTVCFDIAILVFFRYHIFGSGLLLCCSLNWDVMSNKSRDVDDWLPYYCDNGGGGKTKRREKAVERFFHSDQYRA